ncbi:hypothetical protein BC941DRAFT_474132 [Chlamydoabsidia padenii]|nr:hypothetical protein BC941DRAFT_474132 [Chlamydoabsidia padenii]
MSHNNPFEESQNPWSNESTGTPTGGPRFGNAYEDNNNSWSGRMPSPSDYQHQHNNTRVESNKTEYVPGQSPSPSPASPPNAYQFAGTRLGNQDYTTGNAYGSSSPPATPPRRPADTENNTTENKDEALPPVWDERRMHPSKLRLLLRFVLFVAAVGHLGFAAGASPKSGQPVPFDSPACFYYLYAVAIITIFWTLYHIGYYMFRRFSKGTKMNRPIMLGMDLLLAILWGIGVIVEVAKYRCPPGGHDGWCDFYNVSIFFGFVDFAGFIAAVAWDTFGGCITHKR